MRKLQNWMATGKSSLGNSKIVPRAGKVHQETGKADQLFPKPDKEIQKVDEVFPKPHAGNEKAHEFFQKGDEFFGIPDGIFGKGDEQIRAKAHKIRNLAKNRQNLPPKP